MQDIITANIEERIQNLLPLYDLVTSKEMSGLSVTAKTLIQKAKSNDDYVLVAALVYSNIEENLIYRYKLEHQDKYFVINYEEYIELADSIKIGDRFLLKKFNQKTGEYELLSPRAVEFDLCGKPIKVEMPPIIRFFKAGLIVTDAKKATNYWMVLNKIRHKSPDNEAFLSKFFKDLRVSRKEYLIQALDFFKVVGLYTKE